MNNKRLIIITVLLNLALLNPLEAKLRLPAILSSNMVLQRNDTIRIWGWAEANEKITLKASWIDGNMSTISLNDGSWSIELPTLNGKDPQTIQIQNSSSSIFLENILFGEVWLCSGQSNMEQPVKGFPGQPTYGSLNAIAQSSNPNLRLFTVKPKGATSPKDDIEEYIPWQTASPHSVPDFSAVAYFFGQQLQEILDVPVGLIHSSYGASRVQAWMSKDELGIDQKAVEENELFEERPNHVPTALYNAMINPIVPFHIKGAIWYQGESDRMDPDGYKELFPAMVKHWRTRWGLGDFPFYYVQITPFVYWGQNDEFQEIANSAFIREAQLECLNRIPNSGIAITMDLGDERCIHPPKKKEVAERLLYNALNQTYGFENLDYASPILDEVLSEEGEIILKFINAESGLYSYGELEGFEIAGKEKVFYPAKAEIIENNELVVKSEQVSKPVAVRYAWSNWVVGTLYDANLLPASSFRTDNWDDATRAPKMIKK